MKMQDDPKTIETAGRALQQAMEVSKLEAALAAKDRDLADANHALLLANNSADAFRRVAEQRQGEIEELTRKLAVAEDQSFQWRQKYENLDNYIAGCLV